MCRWNVIPLYSRVVIQDSNGDWIATTKSQTVATAIVKEHNEKEPIQESNGLKNRSNGTGIVKWSYDTSWKN